MNNGRMKMAVVDISIKIEVALCAERCNVFCNRCLDGLNGDYQKFRYGSCLPKVERNHIVAK